MVHPGGSTRLFTGTFYLSDDFCVRELLLLLWKAIHTQIHTKYVCADWDSWDHYSVWQQSKKALIPTGTAESAAKDRECHLLKPQPASLSDPQSAFILTRTSLYQIWLIINRSQIWSADIRPFHTAICDSLMVSPMQCSVSTFIE